MSYQSPLHIIKGFATEDSFEINDANLIRLRKQLLAELNLSGETTIKVNQKQYSKDQIIKTIDALLGNPNLELHDFIFNNKLLLNYLEDESQILNYNLYSKLELNENIKSKLENILYTRFIIQFKKGFNTHIFSQAEEAFFLMYNLSEKYKNICYVEVQKSLNTFTLFLNELESRIFEMQNNDLKFLTQHSLSAFINILPEEFEDQKNEITARLINLTVAYHNLKKYNKVILIGISSNLLKINCTDEEYIKLIRSNHNTFSSSATGVSSKWAYLIFAFIFAFNALKYCSKNETTNSSKNENIKYNNIKLINNTISEKDIKGFRKMVAYRFDKNATSDDNYIEKYTGNNPFLNPIFGTKNTLDKKKEHSLMINNNTDFDLIIFYFDSTIINFNACFIKQSERHKMYINNKINFIFYLGKNFTLKYDEKNIALNRNCGFNYKISEYFNSTNKQNIDLLSKTFELNLIPNNQGEINTNWCELNIDTKFIENKNTLLKYHNFILTKLDH